MEARETETAVIRELKAGNGEFVSGEAISRAIGISRAAVWKHITALRKSGYGIEGSSRKGYRLGSQTLPFGAIELKASLGAGHAGVMGSRVFFFESLESTNVTASELARKGLPEGTIIVADGQTGGKGRRARSWHSPRGVNLYTSVILRPDMPPHEAQPLTLLSAVAAAEAISAFSPKRPSVKWPNDVLLDSKKTAGILMEMSSEADRINFIVLGIGVNLNMDAAGAPADVRSIAASLKEKSGKEINRLDFALTLYLTLEKWYKVFMKEGAAPVIAAWRGYFDMEGKPVRIRDTDISGICLGIDDSGALLVRSPSGAVKRVLSGDVE